MDGVTDAAMRHVTTTIAKPDVLFTEFTSAEGVRAGALRLMKDFKYSEIERPIVAQIFGNDPDAFYLTTLVVCALGFDGVDINMGCPAKNVSERGAGAGLIRTPEIAQKIIKQTQQAITDYASGLQLKDTLLSPKIIELTLENNYPRRIIPVSVKTRLGYDQPIAVDWVKFLVEQDIQALSLHGRTLKQYYTGVADWEEIANAAAAVKDTDVVFLGNGDIEDIDQAKDYAGRYEIDGVLIGRAAMGNPWVFSGHTPDKQERLETALLHARAYESLFPGESFLPVRKHLSWYAKGFPDASELRRQLVLADSSARVAKICLLE